VDDQVREDQAAAAVEVVEVRPDRDQRRASGEDAEVALIQQAGNVGAMGHVDAPVAR
jgi:hypothetical protein